jgi:hypothetical protein
VQQRARQQRQAAGIGDGLGGLQCARQIAADQRRRPKGVVTRLNRERPSRKLITHEIRFSLLSTPI